MASALPRPDDALPPLLTEQREQLFATMRNGLQMPAERLKKVRAIFEASPVLGQGNPKVTKHPMKRSECWDIRQRAGLNAEDARAKEAARESACGDRFMSPIGKGDKGETICIDQYEFPGIPCEYPVVYATAKEASDLCQAVGKRICDAHEWEGACAGELRPANEEYLWDRPRRIEMEYFKNKDRQILWAYGPKKDHSKCATGSEKSPKCEGGGWDTCGSNTYPAGAYPECVSSFGVYDQHGNAAEHMNLPMKPEELSSRGGLGETEMKGSWFIFLRGEAHEDDCRWRAPAWHSGRVASPTSHLNYHLGFRCCKSVR
jgi:sulfatase modifying factor 1